MGEFSSAMIKTQEPAHLVSKARPLFSFLHENSSALPKGAPGPCCRVDTPASAFDPPTRQKTPAEHAKKQLSKKINQAGDNPSRHRPQSRPAPSTLSFAFFPAEGTQKNSLHKNQIRRVMVPAGIGPKAHSSTLSFAFGERSGGKWAAGTRWMGYNYIVTALGRSSLERGPFCPCTRGGVSLHSGPPCAAHLLGLFRGGDAHPPLSRVRLIGVLRRRHTRPRACMMHDYLWKQRTNAGENRI